MENKEEIMMDGSVVEIPDVAKIIDPAAGLKDNTAIRLLKSIGAFNLPAYFFKAPPEEKTPEQLEKEAQEYKEWRTRGTRQQERFARRQALAARR